MKYLITCISCLVLASTLSAATITWNTNGQGNWSDPNNWSPQQVPKSKDDVIITDGTVILNAMPYNINSLHITNTGALEILEDGELHIKGSTEDTAVKNYGILKVHTILSIMEHEGAYGLSSFGYTTIYQSALLYIEDVHGYGIVNNYTSHFNHFGEIIIDHVGNSGIFNIGSFFNYESIFIQHCAANSNGNGSGLHNTTENFFNAGELTIQHSDAYGLYSSTSFYNGPTGSVSISSYSTYGIYITPSGSIENDGGTISLSAGTYSGWSGTHNRGEFLNDNCGELYVDRIIRNIGSSAVFTNNALLYSNSYPDHQNSATFINNGIIHDPLDAFGTTTIQNNGILIRPIQGPIYVNQPVSNALGLGNLNGFTVGYWVDPGINFKVGEYDENSNEFTPNDHGVGLNEMAVQIDFGSCGSRYLSIPISGGIQYPPSPFAIPNENQEDQETDISLQLEVFPNPAQDFVNITLPYGKNDNGVYQIQLFGIDGKNLDQKVIDAQTRTTTLNIHQYPSGLYTLHILDESGNSTIRKLVIE